MLRACDSSSSEAGRSNVARRMARALGMDGLTTFTGHVPPAEVADYLRMGDAAIVYYKDIEVNYFRESMKLREMLALGLKVVCNDVGDLERFKDYTYQTGSGHEEVAHQLVSVLLGRRCDGREVRNGLRPPLPRLEGHRRQAAPQNHRGAAGDPRESGRCRGNRRLQMIEGADSALRSPRGGLRARPSRGSRHGDGRAPAAGSSTSRVDRALPVATRRDLARPDAT